MTFSKNVNKKKTSNEIEVHQILQKKLQWKFTQYSLKNDKQKCTKNKSLIKKKINAKSPCKTSAEN